MSDEKKSAVCETDEEGGSFVSLLVSIIIFVAWGVLWTVNRLQPDSGWALWVTIAQVAVISVVIWQVCDPFADAAQWVGEKFRLPGSVRGATLDAVASSMPELFSGIFFVLVAMSSVGGTVPAGSPEQQAALQQAGAEGFGSTIATCAGSAVYNMILIPAFCALVISFSRPERPTIDVEPEVITRDGVWFLCCNILLVLFLFEDQMMWWMGLCFIGLYCVYIGQLAFDARLYRRRMTALTNYFAQFGSDTPASKAIEDLKAEGLRISPTLAIKAQADRIEVDDDPETHSAGVFFGYVDIPLNGRNAAAVLFCCTLIVVAACYFLVKATIATASILAVPTFFVAVILAAAASSVPDTFLAIAAARRGDDSGAVSNAFGSNIFDICICLSIPLLVNSWLTDWQPVSLLQDGKPISGLVGLRVLLVVLTIINLAIMWQNRQITRTKAWFLCGLYVMFVGYAVLGSLNLL